MASHAAREARRNFKIRYGIVRAQGPGPQWPLLVPRKPALQEIATNLPWQCELSDLHMYNICCHFCSIL